MPALQCTVVPCSYNEKGCCCRPSIQVKGQTAHVSTDTACQSFAEKTQNQMISGVQYHSPNQSLSVDCDAHRCVYNKDQKCSAESVAINYGYSGTECSSFKQS
ncbi:DUF1540 domain-containing protein [Aminipila luticellarii]|uniref:DUF1540 domain-containing protein n=1 Tax=Aminipila luticellarii TaxID=2507160 RepID=A0A410PVK8_9FIRM|nr:DUF1540 domain-containing protein [Aminipila luticellarii]QAT42954.1 DUF1540 domain-containing protein [Aminipila luticellarii]